MGYIEVNSITNYANFCFYFTATGAALWFATFVACVFPQREVLKHLNRVNWVSTRSRKVLRCSGRSLQGAKGK